MTSSGLLVRSGLYPFKSRASTWKKGSSRERARDWGAWRQTPRE